MTRFVSLYFAILFAVSGAVAVAEATPLHDAAQANDIATATRLIEQGADVNAKGEDGYTPLHNAAWKNAREVAVLLIAQGAYVNLVDESGDTPLHRAALENAREVAALLIEQGADIGAKGRNGKRRWIQPGDWNTGTSCGCWSRFLRARTAASAAYLSGICPAHAI